MANMNYDAIYTDPNLLKKKKETEIGVVPTNPTLTSSTVSQPDYTSQINALYQNQTDALVNQLRQKIAQSKQEQQNIIVNAPKQFDPMRAQSELTKSQQLRQVLERNANLGDRGGIGRSQALQTQTAGENRLNAINLQQQGVIDEANQQIANLESQGRFEEANIIAQQNLAKIQALISSQQRQDEIAREDRLRADEIARQQEQINYARQQDADALARQDFQTSIAANYRDLSAYANQLRLQGAPQWQIDMVEATRQQKIIDQNLDPRTGQPLPTAPDFNQTLTKWNAGLTLTPEEMAVIGATTSKKPVTSSGGGTTLTQNRNYAMDLWKALGKANDTVASILGIPVGTPFGGGTTTLTTTDIEDMLRGTSGDSTADFIVQLNNAGYLEDFTPDELREIMNEFNVTDLMLSQANNRANIGTGGIPLPSQTGGLYSR